MKMTYLRLLVNDFDTCYAFYSDVIGLKPTWGKPGEAYASFHVADHVSLSIYRRDLMLEALNLPHTAQATDHHGFALILEANDVDAEFARLYALGAATISQPCDMPRWGIRCFHLTDPEGNLIEINKELPKSLWDEGLKNHPDAEHYPNK